MKWDTTLREAIRDNKSGLASSSRIVALLSGVTLSVCTILLTVLAFFKIELVPALTVFGGALAAQAGSGYVATKMTEKKNDV